ncbi:hypothetical protein Trydic_g13668 [Trypoxylus dichotomus]
MSTEVDTGTIFGENDALKPLNLTAPSLQGLEDEPVQQNTMVEPLTWVYATSFEKGGLFQRGRGRREGSPGYRRAAAAEKGIGRAAPSARGRRGEPRRLTMNSRSRLSGKLNEFPEDMTHTPKLAILVVKEITCTRGMKEKIM